MASMRLKLEVGKAYFGCGYYLRNLPTPSIQTWIYLGADMFGEDKEDQETYHYFESPHVYFEKEITKESAQYKDQEDVAEEMENKSEPTKMRVPASHLETLIYDYEGLCEFVNSLGNEPNADKAF